MNVPPPRIVAWELTAKCNLACRHCRMSGERGRELTREEALRLVDDLSVFAHPILILTGGEPLLCPWVWDVATRAREKGMKPVLGTNGTLIDGEVAARIASVGISRVSVSIDFPTACEHDRFRGVPGGFEAAMRGIGLLRQAGVEVQINSTITRLNRDRIGDLHDLAVRVGAKAFHPFLLVATGHGAEIADVGMTASEYEETLTWICHRQADSPLEVKPTDAPHYQRICRQCGREAKKGCLAGTGFCFVSATGDLKPCGYFDLKLGNIRERAFAEIWQTSPVLDDLRHPDRLKGKCGVCEYRQVCGGCRARALAATGDYLAEEPCCAHVPERRILELLQTEFPLVARPYRVLADRLGCGEEELYVRVKDLKRRGLIRRIGPVWNVGKAGGVSTLAAAEVLPEMLEPFAEKVNSLPEVTHNYGRDGRFNLWFTLVAPDRRTIDVLLADLAKEPGVVRLMELPAVKTYKLKAVFT